MKLKFNRKLFESIVYIIVIITGILTLVFKLVGVEILAWVLITLGGINLTTNLTRKKKI